MRSACLSAAGLALMLSGCSTLQFHPGFSGEGATYFDPQPVLILRCNKDKEVVAEMSTMPGRMRSVTPRAGLLGGEMTVSFENGLITSFNQTNEPLDPELVTTFTGLLSGGRGATESTRASPALRETDPPLRMYITTYGPDGAPTGFSRLSFPALQP
jgi:hypothetical protein